MCCKPYRNILHNYYSASADLASTINEGKSTSDLSKSRYVKGHLANWQMKIHMRRHEGSKQLYQRNDCNGRYTTLQSLRDNMTCGHVGSVELWNVKVVKSTRYTGATYDDACVTCRLRFEVTVLLSTLIVTNWAAKRSFTSLNLLIHNGKQSFSCSVCDYQRRRPRWIFIICGIA